MKGKGDVLAEREEALCVGVVGVLGFGLGAGQGAWFS